MSFIVPTFDQLKHVKAHDATFMRWFYNNATAEELTAYNEFLREKDAIVVEPVEQPEVEEDEQSLDCDDDEYESEAEEDDTDDEPWWWE